VNKTLLLSLCLFAACKGHDDKKVDPAKTAAADQWAKKEAPKVDASKDPDLAKMTELAQGGPGETEYPQADAVVAVEHDDFTLKADGTIVHKTKSIVKVLDALRAKEKFADVHLPFDGRRRREQEVLRPLIARALASRAGARARSGAARVVGTRPSRGRYRARRRRAPHRGGGASG